MEKLTLVELNRTKIRDSYWDRYIDLVKSTIIPYQWNILNDNIPDVQTSHGLMNFKIAAKRETGEFYGAVFQDTDVAKWLEAVALSLASKKDEELERTADEVIELIAEAQQPDGYINTYFTIKEPGKRWSNLEEGHELYTAGHLMEAAAAYYRATGKDKFLNCICKFADLICNVFSPEHNKDGYPGHQEVEIGLVKLYEVTGKKAYLAQAKEFLERRGREPNYFLEEEKSPDYKRIFPEFENYLPLYSQSHKPVREQDTAEGHAVRAVYMYCAMADVAYEYQDQELFRVCTALWDDITQQKMYITGSIGSSGILERFTTGYDLPNNCNYSETCASIGLALFGRRMAQITRDSKYMDVVERALYNTLLSGVAMDGQSFFYVNPLEVWPDNCLPRTSMEHVKPVRQKWFGVACCPPNIARTLASIGEYIYFYDRSSVWINLFISSETSMEIEGHPVHLSQKTAFPNDGNIEISIENEDEAEFELAIRIPEYVKKYDLMLDGKPVAAKVQKGYAKVMISGKNPSLVYKFALAPRILRANPLVKEDVGKIAVMKGPVVYCLEEVDNGKNLPAVFLDPEQELQESYEENLLGGTTIIRTAGKKVTTDGWQSNELYKESDLTMESIPLMFVPYPYWGNRRTGEMLVWVKEFI